MDAVLKNLDVNILFVEDDEIDLMAFERFLRQRSLPYRYETTDSVRGVAQLLSEHTFDVAVVDYNLLDGTGLDVLELVDDRFPVIFVTGQGDQRLAVNAMKAGIYDYLIKDNSRNYLELLPVTIDNAISHRKAEERLAEAEAEIQKLLWVVSKTDNAMVIADVHGKVEWVNEGFEQLTGFGVGEVTNANTQDLPLFKKSGLNPHSKHFKKMMAEKGPVSYEIENVSRDGRSFWSLSTITPVLSENGEVEKVIAIGSDITKRKEAEIALVKAKQEAERLAKVKEEFLANMSHEIRTPMNGILGMVQMLSETSLSEEQAKYLNSIQFASQNLLHIINDVLDFSKIEAGQVEYESIPFDLGNSLREIIHMFKKQAEAKGLELTLKHDDSIPKWVIGDPTKMNQILINLLGNAMKFTEHGFVSLSSSITQKTPNGIVVTFDVADSGIGISKEKQTDVFESFKQAESETTRKFGGTGLGLTIVKKLSEGLGGTVSLKSELGKGSIFSVSLPLKFEEVPKAADTENREANISRLKGKRVLLVEDNELNQMVASQFLKSADVVVEVAVNGEEAYQKVAEQQYDLVLMDIQMPILDGYAASRKIRENGMDVPIVAMTAHAMEGELQRCKSAGMNDYLTKPIKKDKLLSTISNIIK